ncbi:MAG: hypothetical protein K1X83_02595 [Oligoflexia bacterium]|nr:hypothetical protein [Oligoflexia bacterium]
MWLTPPKTCAQPKQAGVVVIIVALTLVSLLVIFGLAINVGSIYRAHTALQSAADTASLAAARLLALQPDLEHERVASYAIDLMRHNLENLNFEAAEIARMFEGEESDDSHRISVASSGEAVTIALASFHRTVFGGSLAFVPEHTIVRVESKAYVPSVRVALMIDQDTAMTTQLADLPTACSGSSTPRLCAAKEAAKAFIDRLLPLDQVLIVGVGQNENDDTNSADKLNNFLNDARIVFPCPEGATEHCDRAFITLGAKGAIPAEDSRERQDLRAAIDGISNSFNYSRGGSSVPGWYTATNPAAGFYRARAAYTRARTEGGAPTIDALVMITASFPAYNWDPDNLVTGSLEDSVPPMATFDPASPVMRDFHLDGALGGLCDDLTNPQRQMLAGEPPLNPIHLCGTGNCYQNPQFQSNRTERWRRRGMIDAILEADRARSEGIAIFTFGLGQKDDSVIMGNYPANHYSPFQAPDGFGANYTGGVPLSTGRGIKPFFMARLANDQPKLLNPEYLPSPSPANDDYFWDFPCVQSGRAIVNQPRGKFLSVNTGNQAVQGLTSLARIIRGAIH